MTGKQDFSSCNKELDLVYVLADLIQIPANPYFDREEKMLQEHDYPQLMCINNSMKR